MNIPKPNLRVYVNVLRIRAAWRFDIATVLMRLFVYMFTIGTVTMLTLSGYSAFVAGTVAATLSLVTFLVGPRIAKLIDERGQRDIVPVVSLLSIAGLVLLIAAVLFSLPLPVCYVGAAIIGVAPNGPALARTRWAYLIRTKQQGAGSIDMRTAYAYEGVLEDITFAISPALNIALAATVHPVAGMVFGGLCLLAGAILLRGARSTEPQPGWMPDDADADGISDADGVSPAQNGAFTELDSPWMAAAHKTVFSLSGTVRTMFMCTVMVGLVFGSFDSTTVVLCQDLGQTTLAGSVMCVSGLISAMSSLLFGTLKFETPLSKILLVTGALYGVGYALTVIIFNEATLWVFTCFASLWFAPFLISCNNSVERAVPGSRLTEGITWMNAGNTAGFAIGPTVAGMLMDVLGARFGYALVCVAGLLIPVVLAVAQRTLRRELDAAE